MPRTPQGLGPGCKLCSSPHICFCWWIKAALSLYMPRKHRHRPYNTGHMSIPKFRGIRMRAAECYNPRNKISEMKFDWSSGCCYRNVHFQLKAEKG